MTPLQIDNDPIDIPDGATIRRPDPTRPFVAMSNRKRWSKCALSAVLPQLRTPSGPSAEEGTEAHKVAEWALGQKFAVPGTPPSEPSVLPPEGLIDFDYSDRGIHDWRAQVEEYALTYADKASYLFSDTTGPVQCLVEYKIEDVVIHGVRVYTVADVVLWNPTAKRLVVGDYKFGRSPVGVGTREEPNEQCAGAAALIRLRDLHAPNGETPEQIGLFVYQPRTYAGEPWQPLGIMDRQWLADQAAKLDNELKAVTAAAASLSRGELFTPNPGDHCTYCPSARWCPAAAAYGAKALDVEANKIAVADLTPDEVMAQWSMRSAFKQYEEDLKERVRILHEKNHPAVSVRYRKGPLRWLSEPAAVEAFLMADRMDMLKPPAVGKAEGVIPASELAALTGRCPDVPTFVAVNGKNPSVATNAFAKYLNTGEK